MKLRKSQLWITTIWFENECEHRHTRTDIDTHTQDEGVQHFRHRGSMNVNMERQNRVTVILHTHTHTRLYMCMTTATLGSRVKGHLKKSRLCYMQSVCGWRRCTETHTASIYESEVSLSLSHLAMDISHICTAFVLTDLFVCVFCPQCRDWPEIAGDHEADGLSEDRRSGGMCTQRHMWGFSGLENINAYNSGECVVIHSWK